MNHKIVTKELHKGMYVSALDRSWLETPFMFQGFIIRTDDELKEWRECGSYVYIEEERAAKSKEATTHYGKVKSEGEPPPHPRHQMAVEDEITAARQVRKEAEEHYYNPTYQGLQDIGVEPHYLNEEVMTGMFRVVERYKNKIRKDVIFKGVKWWDILIIRTQKL